MARNFKPDDKALTDRIREGQAKIFGEDLEMLERQQKNLLAQSFEVQMASSGRIVLVPRDKTVVQALTEAGVEVLTSCEQGMWVTCLTRVLEGVPDHKDMYLTPEEHAANDQRRVVHA